ncbi:hypothetical protein AVEN_235451-1 [Araneus ventricosus]|uniref:Uncharacterized protein n=1 Tax=Araneus ventricosus TaxID=182803 RepID=A0A4Y2A401_ARAVE|nr:hypothetical protein AVEN_235451-1 [Araneus ventricosus]
MTMMTPELAHPSPDFCTTPTRRRLTQCVLIPGHVHDGSKVELGFEPGNLWTRDLTTRPTGPWRAMGEMPNSYRIAHVKRYDEKYVQHIQVQDPEENGCEYQKNKKSYYYFLHTLSF